MQETSHVTDLIRSGFALPQDSGFFSIPKQEPLHCCPLWHLENELVGDFDLQGHQTPWLNNVSTTSLELVLIYHSPDKRNQRPLIFHKGEPTSIVVELLYPWPQYIETMSMNHTHYRHDCLPAVGHGEKAFANKEVITTACQVGVGQPDAAQKYY